MKFYKYKRSRSFTGLSPGCLRVGIFNFSSQTAGQLQTKLDVKSLWDEGMKVCEWDLGHL